MPKRHKLLEHDDQEVRKSALNTLILNAQMRGQRLALGPMIRTLANVSGQRRRTIYDCKNTTKVPGDFVRGENDRNNQDFDLSVNQAYDGLGTTYDFFKKEFNRNSIDNRGMRLDANVHYDRRYGNAYWDGRQMVFGDGDGKIFLSFTNCIDVIGHELMHGVTQCECNLEYYGQSGALNESISDVFGSMIKQYAENQTVDEADWFIGKGLFGPSIKGVALRSMKAPGTAYDDPVLGRDPQPSSMEGYEETPEDNGGVHINSGIPNHAFYLTAKALGGYAWKQAGKIWYMAMPRIPQTATFQQASDIIYLAAVQLYKKGSKEADAVGEGWSEVGLPPREFQLETREVPSGRYRVDTNIEDKLSEIVDLVFDQVLDGVMDKVSSKKEKRRGKDTTELTHVK